MSENTINAALRGMGSNRVTMERDVVSDSHDYRRHEIIMRVIEREYSLKASPASKEA